MCRWEGEKSGWSPAEKFFVKQEKFFVKQDFRRRAGKYCKEACIRLSPAGGCASRAGYRLRPVAGNGEGCGDLGGWRRVLVVFVQVSQDELEALP